MKDVDKYTDEEGDPCFGMPNPTPPIHSDPAGEEKKMQKRYEFMENVEQKIGYTVGWADAIEWKEREVEKLVAAKNAYEVMLEGVLHFEFKNYEIKRLLDKHKTAKP